VPRVEIKSLHHFINMVLKCSKKNQYTGIGIGIGIV
jgi:hypothetical protein